MPRKPCYWTRKSELGLVEFIKARPFIWKQVGNTNHQIQRKYKAYAEFAAKLGSGFTASSVRDRWVNIRSTYNHNVRRVQKSISEPRSKTAAFVPCWPLWLPLQFLRNSNVPDKDDQENLSMANSTSSNVYQETDTHSIADANLGQRNKKEITITKLSRKGKKFSPQCKQVLNHLILSMKGLVENSSHEDDKKYWFFARHVTESLNRMSTINANSAANCILALLKNY